MQQDYKMYINGEWINSSSGKKIETLNPETNEVWATVPEANDEDVDFAVQSAQRAFVHRSRGSGGRRRTTRRPRSSRTG